ncbi:glycoside hydrolase family 43 protein [Bacillus solitudinis]|uniref:glycoside hydrolase family 43 protein n=1 Tax=Bacillus solitudinis TaxID=2014074 RepID=UPI000C23AFF0|nr:glycoside hydrolase family 43 protein [Bacillus solitudinis]
MNKKEEYAGYLFTYFKGEAEDIVNGEQVYFALSKGNDPLHWQELNGGKPILTSELGEKGVRDPFMIRSPLNGKVYLLGTDLKIQGNGNWERAVAEGSKAIMIWESSDFVHWSKQRMVELAPPDAGCTWAPEATFDAENEEFIVYWASMLEESSKENDKSRYHQMLYSKTKDFVEFSEPRPFIDYGYSVIDATMMVEKNKFYRFAKGKHVFQESNESLLQTNYITLNRNIEEAFMVRGEGPIIFKSNIEEKWYLYIDEYGLRGYLPLETTNLDSGEWTEPDHYSLPFKPRHGSIIPITLSEYDRLLSAYGTKEGENV